ncbi:MAG: permease-like cell division protein FtsX [Sandaracinaceae bacterium]|nr:permease-like cell division protein FtsX [Sandaracinaceae bacterium]
MPFKTAITRAARAMREDLRLHVVAISSLTVAFLCLAAAIFAVTNLSSVAESWARQGRMSVYLVEGASPEDVAQLRLLLDGLPEVREVEHVTSREARAELAREAGEAELGRLPADLFPASLEVTLAGGTSAARTAAIAERVRRVRAVEAVETYEAWFGRLEALVATGRVVALVLAGLVLLCVLFVVANTIRLAISGRRDEIEVLKLCGASNGFVRGPFIVEGAVQGILSSGIAVGLLLAAFLALRGDVDATIAALAGVRAAFIHPTIAVLLVVGGGLVGAAGSALSLRRYLGV